MGQVSKRITPRRGFGLQALAKKVLDFHPEKSQYSMEEMMELTGLRRHKVMYLCKNGLIRQPFREYSRSRRKLPRVYFPVQDVLKALIITDIRDANFSLAKVRKLAAHLEELGTELNADAYLLTNGKSIQVARTEDEVMDVLKHNRQLYLLVSLQDKVAKLTA